MVASLRTWLCGICCLATAMACEAAVEVQGLDNPKRTPNRYIVLFNKEATGVRAHRRAINAAAAAANREAITSNREIASAVGADLAARFRARVLRTWYSGFQGVLLDMDDAAARRMADDPRVAMIVADQPTEISNVQANPPWHLDRIDQPDYPLDHQYFYQYSSAQYPTVPNTQHSYGVVIYVLDSGVRSTHTEFSNAFVGSGSDYVFTYPNPNYGGNIDCNGHGTHVAGLIAGATYGVVKDARIVPLKIVDCSGAGTTASMIDGIHEVTTGALINGPHGSAPYYFGIDLEPYVVSYVANISVQGKQANPAVTQAITESLNAGVIWVSSAGPGGSDPAVDACSYTPAGVPGVITVTSSRRVQSLFGQDSDAVSIPPGNYGSCVTLFAPGDSMLSAWSLDGAGHGSNTATRVETGTSMAAPLVAGVAAIYAAKHPKATPAQVKSAILSSALLGKISGSLQGTPNRLLSVGVPGNTGLPGGGVGGGGTGGGGNGVSAALQAVFDTLLLSP